MDKYFRNLDPPFEINKNYKFSFKDNTVSLYDGNKLIIKAVYELIGSYNIYNSVWYWAHNIQLIDRSIAMNKTLLDEYAKKIKGKTSEDDKMHFYATNSSFYLSHKNLMDPIKLGLYLTKGLYYIPICYGKDDFTCYAKKPDKKSLKRIEYLAIKKIIYL